jgi:hypothetical protein
LFFFVLFCVFVCVQNVIISKSNLINSKENGRNKIVNPGSVCCQYLSLFVHLVFINFYKQDTDTYIERTFSPQSDMSSFAGEAQQFAAMTGVDEGTANMYMEMSGGSLDVAISLFFDQGGGGGGGFGGAGAVVESAQNNLPSFFGSVWGSDKSEIPDSWMQGLEFSKETPLGLVQAKNGPCGVLAILQGNLVVQLRSKENFGPSYAPTDEQLAHAIAATLSFNAPFRLCTWSGGKVGEGVETHDVGSEAGSVHAFIMSHLDQYKGRGALALIVYSAFLSRGSEKVQQDVAMGGGMMPIVFGPFNLCTTELMSLLMRGVANGNVGAYSQTGAKVDHFAGCNKIGLLSTSEIETSIPIADSLKSPSDSVWILHGGDHFTTAWSSAPSQENEAEFQLTQWNGLPPGGPRLATLVVSAPNGVVGPAPERREEPYVKPVAGEIDSIVQADPNDKKDKPKQFREWKYECVLAVDEKDVQGKERPADAPPPQLFDQGEMDLTKGWRCRHCYGERFKTMFFGMNDPGTERCENCKKTRQEAGWAIWLPFDALPRGFREQMERRHGPKITTCLRTKFPSCTVAFDDETNPPSV